MNSSAGLAIWGKKLLMFPLFFQDELLQLAWGAHDPLWLQLFKRVFILPPAAAILAHCWLTIACVLTIIVRVKRREFVSLVILSWWDLGRCILAFWGGTLRFLLFFSGSILVFTRFIVMMIWALISDVVFAPLRIVRDVGGGTMRPGVPWIAVIFTIVWCVLEAIIFTFVTSSLVMDTLSGLTGRNLTMNDIQIPLFFMLLVFVLGSYAVLATWVEAIRLKQIGAILKIGVFELFVMFLEVVFLYREFVDSLSPWIAQHASADFKLGIIGTLGIAGFAWLGVRGLSWFLFANAGTPTLMAIIQRKGLHTVTTQHGTPKGSQGPAPLTLVGQIFGKIKSDADWVQARADAVLSSFLLPPIQIIASTINCVMLLIMGQNIFELPFHSITEVAPSKLLRGRITGSGEK